MKQSLPTMLVLAVICASAALALAQTMRDKAIPSSHSEVVRPTSQRLGPMGPSEHLRTGSVSRRDGFCVFVSCRTHSLQ